MKSWASRKAAYSFLSLSLGLWWIVSLATLNDAHAYLDPGSISMVMQVVVAAIAGGFMFFRNGWTKTKSLLSRLVGRKAVESAKPTESSEK